MTLFVVTARLYVQTAQKIKLIAEEKEEEAEEEILETDCRTRREGRRRGLGKKEKDAEV